jgi:hypothetical protein
MARVFYYYYYLFYTKVIPDDEPNATVIFTLGFTQSLWLNGILDFILIKGFCYKSGKWPMIFLTLALIGVNYLYYFRSKKYKEIIQEKPSFRGNHVLSAIIVLVFALIGISWMFWGGIVSRNILENCK